MHTICFELLLTNELSAKQVGVFETKLLTVRLLFQSIYDYSCLKAFFLLILLSFQSLDSAHYL